MGESERAVGQGPRRFDARLDAYLRRNLPPQDHDRISTSVTCVASLTGEIQHKHRYAILGYRCVYLAEVPPKNLRVAVHLKDVQSVEMLNDLPTFLKPKESENTVHVQVHYHKKAKDKSAILSSMTKLSPSIFRKQKEPPTTSTDSLLPPSPPQSPPISPTPSSRALPSQRSKSLSPKSPLLLATKPPQHPRPLPSLDGNPSQKKLSADPHTRQVGSNVTNYGSSLSVNSSSSKSSGDSEEVFTWTATSLSPNAQSGLTVNHRSQSSNTLAIPGPLSAHQRSSSSNDLYTSSRLTNSKPQHHSSLMSISDTVGFSADSNSTAEDKTEVGVMDLYILQPVSDFYHQFCVAWDNWNIQHLAGAVETNVPAKSPMPQRDRFSLKYTSLKQELLHSRSLEGAAGLGLELSTAAQRYSVIKRLFWEDCDLYDHCVDQLKAHLDLTKILQYSAADRIEYSIILLDMLYQMLRETHHIKKKLVVLSRNSGHSLLSLATAIINHLPGQTHTEVAPFKKELTQKSCGIVYELLQVCLQVKWPEADKCSLVLTKVVEQLVEQQGMANFLGYMVDYIRLTIGLNSEPLTEVEPSDQVTLYHISFALNTLVRNSSANALKKLRARLVEDFRYYVSVTRSKQVLPDNPLSKKTVSFLQHVKSKIL